MWWVWVLAVALVWMALAVVGGVVLGRGMRMADQRELKPSVRLAPADSPVTAPAPQRAAVRTRRRAVPLPPVGIALAALAVALETVGFVVRLRGENGPVASALSMDAPYSVPRTFVAVLFAVAAVAAVAGASRLPGRRSWWLGVGLVAGLIATVKVGSTVHVNAMNALSEAFGDAGALAVSVAAAAAVIGALWFLSRTERRDRRRVLGVLGLYAAASVGLSGLSSVAATTFTANIATAATYLEESGEALAGVAFLMAVLIGVAPRLVLPAEWALRRTADAQTLEAPVADARHRPATF
ncbi:hypothetical protein SAMN05660748_1006 [Blastococcus aggregatus]|uniref:Uncharacterized protein n=1 Tax=Blastococcus aggregatus TaxID=38502 RepID=A0A285V2E1_9ACTN|nr:hypothetical protein [Blastococcus aggregatus]SOC47748.1 hypothetical protein SAMN05660748_1006 [Blastococcus aggregatus]